MQNLGENGAYYRKIPKISPSMSVSLSKYKPPQIRNAKKPSDKFPLQI